MMGQTEFLYNAFKRPQDSIPNFFEATESDIVAHTHDVQNWSFAFHLPEKDHLTSLCRSDLDRRNNNKYYIKFKK